ncbi:MAG: ATP-binding protein [Candidatus Thermoplasmatota archaeon]|nr:ATP-binding protein [Candidatus Thermoplasmatota archaeon]
MASGPEHDDETPSLASRVLDLLDDDLLGLGEISAETASEPPHDAPALDGVQAPEASDPPASDTPESEPFLPFTDQPMEVAARHDGVEQEHEPEPVEELPFTDNVADDIAVEAIEAPAAPAPSETRRGRKFKPKGMFLGRRRDNDEPVDIKSTVLARHAAMLGSTGSGKTVMAKALIEEAALAGIPALIIDPQGDLARLALGGDASTIEAKGEDAARMRKLMESTEVRIWTPLRSKGLPLCIDPFHAPPADLDPEEAITAWDMVAAGFTSLAGYDVEKAQGKTIKPYLYEVLVQGTRVGLDVADFQSLSRVVREPHDAFLRHLYPECFAEPDEEFEGEAPQLPPWTVVAGDHGLTDFEERLPKATRYELARRLSAFSSGVNQLLFSNGVPINIDAFTEPAVPGKVPLNIVYLNTIQDENQKQYFVQELSRELYDWMLTQQPAEGELKLLFFMDEVAPYLPPHPRNPPAKDLIKLIFKQARKYGVACVLATQNVSDVDYKILAQANTTFVGRFTQPQDVEKVRHLLKESGSDVDLVGQLPTLGPGQFQVVAPDVDENPFPLQCRWLYTDHGAPLSEDQVEELISDDVRRWARSRSAGAHRKRGGSGAADAAARGSRWSDDEVGIVAKSRITAVGGMTAAAHGVVDDSAFEVRLMGGLAVLKDGRDPLYTMQAASNAASVLALGWCLIALLVAWRDDGLDWWWLLFGAGVSGLVGLVIALEWFLAHDADLLLRISKFTRQFQIGLVVWLWTLLVWSTWGELDLLGAAPLLEVVVLWTTLFLAIEGLHRFRLGRLHWDGDSAWSRLSGITAVLTEAQMRDMRASSAEILAAMRWIVHGVTVVLGCLLLIALPAMSEGTGLPGPDSAWMHLVLWLTSLYALMWGSEGWLRMRGRLPEPEA